MSAPLSFILLGDPLEHSRSPQIHRAALEGLSLEGTYEAVTADGPVLDRTIDDLRDGAVTGINITMPLKNAAARACDFLTAEAEVPMSVNTLRLRNGDVQGHSTDVVAARGILSRPEFDQIAPILVLGAGGAAAAMVAATQGKRPLYVSSRDPVRGKALIKGSGDAAVVPFGTAVAGAIVINATPLGMTGQVLPQGILESCSGLVDLAYGPGETPAVAKTRNLGVPAVDGIEFLVMQAAASFEWWTGKVPLVNSMLDAARKN